MEHSISDIDKEVGGSKNISENFIINCFDCFYSAWNSELDVGPYS